MKSPALPSKTVHFFQFISDGRFLQHCDNGVRRGDQSGASLAAHIAVFQGHLNRIDKGIELIDCLLVESLLKGCQYVIEFVGKTVDLSGRECQRGI